MSLGTAVVHNWHSAVFLIVFPFILQAITIAQLMCTGG